MGEDNRQQHGRLFTRYKLAKIVTAACHTDAYSQEKPLAVKGRTSIVHPALPLVRWTYNHWTDLENLLLAARDALIHVDADSLNDARTDSDLYTTKVDSLSRYIRVNRALADIHWNLHKQLVDNASKDVTIKIDSALVVKFGYVFSCAFVLCVRRTLCSFTLLFLLANGSKTTLLMMIKLAKQPRNSWCEARWEEALHDPAESLL